MDISAVQEQLRGFAKARGWEKYHSPKNLSMALAVEAAELMELFQWVSPEESTKASSSPAHVSRVGEELADVLIYALRLADVLAIDVEQAIVRKIEANASKYPADRKHEWTIE